MNMKKIGSMYLIISLCALMTVAVQAAPQTNGSSQPTAASSQIVSIVGSWEIDGMTSPGGPQNGTQFKALGTFMRDGGYVTSANADPSFMATPGYGGWKKIGGHQYALTFRQLLGGADGSFQGTIKVSGNVTLNSLGNEFDGTFYIEISDANGSVLLTDTGTVKGTRLQVE